MEDATDLKQLSVEQLIKMLREKIGAGVNGHVPLSGGLSFPRDDQLAAV